RLASAVAVKNITGLLSWWELGLLSSSRGLRLSVKNKALNCSSFKRAVFVRVKGCCRCESKGYRRERKGCRRCKSKGWVVVVVTRVRYIVVVKEAAFVVGRTRTVGVVIDRAVAVARVKAVAVVVRGKAVVVVRVGTVVRRRHSRARRVACLRTSQNNGEARLFAKAASAAVDNG
ncbi:unnamed protein product, partial [Laminaria digitata]